MEESKTDKMQGKWSFDSIYEYFSSLMKETDNRYEQRFVAQEKAVLTAMVAQEKAVTAALISAEQAVKKAELSADKRFESVNEFRQALTDQTKTLMPRVEAVARADANAEKIAIATTRLDKLESRSSGINASWIVLIQIVSAIASIFAIIGAIIAIILVLSKP